MYGLIGIILAQPGQRDAHAAILLSRAVMRAIVFAVGMLAACAERPPDTPPGTPRDAVDTTTVRPAASRSTDPVDPHLAADRAPVLGLLRLPTVLGEAPRACSDRTVVPLHAEPHWAPIGTIGVEFSCTTVAVSDEMRVVSDVGARRRELPTREIGYEEPAAIVIGVAAGGWYRIRLDDSTAAWTRVIDGDQYRSIESLLDDALAYLTVDWDGRLASAPDAPLLSPMLGGATEGRPVRVRGFRVSGSRTWVRVDVLTRSTCEGDGEPPVVATGWLPLHATSGAPTVWFHSRGC